MDRVRIGELLQPFLSSPGPPVCHSERSEESAVLTDDQLQNISIYLDLLLRWNARVNLTAVREPEYIVTRHFGESIFAARHLFLTHVGTAALGPACVGTGASPVQVERSSTKPAPHLLDLGSGAGFPGLPIKIWAPAIRLTLIESNHKKATFLREVVRHLPLTDVDVFSGRAEAYAGCSADVVTLRAVERFQDILPTAVSLTIPSGRLALLVGEAQSLGISQLTPGFRWEDPIPIPLSSRRVLLIGHRQEPN